MKTSTIIKLSYGQMIFLVEGLKAVMDWQWETKQTKGRLLQSLSRNLIQKWAKKMVIQFDGELDIKLQDYELFLLDMIMKQFAQDILEKGTNKWPGQDKSSYERDTRILIGIIDQAVVNL